MSENTSCAECGMPVRAGEYHPYAACLMFKACHNSETVRANLAFVMEHAAATERAALEVEARISEGRRMNEHTMSMYANRDDMIAALQADITAERTAREAAEAALANATPYCACGDGIIPRDPGYCGTCGSELRHRLQAAEAELALLREEIERLADRWTTIGEQHGVRTFTGNDHKLFANELRTLLTPITRTDGEAK